MNMLALSFSLPDKIFLFPAFFGVLAAAALVFCWHFTIRSGEEASRHTGTDGPYTALAVIFGILGALSFVTMSIMVCQLYSKSLSAS